MATKRLRVGFDFDGVIAYNPFRILRHPVTLFKRTVLGEKRTKFYIPHTPLEKFIWGVLHESSILPGRGLSQIQELSQKKLIDVYLVTGRFGFLEKSLLRWLKKHDLTDTFKRIDVNIHDEQPHHFKKRALKELNLDVFVEDNLDIVEYLYESPTKVYWIYNILDRFVDYPRKYPDLASAIAAIKTDFKILLS